MNRMRIILLVVIIISLISGTVFLPEDRIDESLYLDEVAPDVIFTEKRGAPPRYESKSGIVVFNSYEIAPSIRGYAGPIKLLIALNQQGNITGIKILAHRETMNYVHYMVSDNYMKQFLGKSVHDPFEIDRDIDAISRATESVQALAKTVHASSRDVAARVFGLEVKNAEDERKADTGWLMYLILFFTALLFYYTTRKSPSFLRARDATLILGIMVIGMYLASPFSILYIFNLMLMRISSSALWSVIVISTLASIALAGRFYCGWLCPFGALAEFIGRLPFRKWDISYQTDDRWRRLKYLLLLIIVAVVFTSRRTEYGNYETYVTLFSLHGNMPAWVFAVFMLVINIRVERFWCRYLCPVAAFTGICSRKDSRYVSRKDCPMANRSGPLISECIRCNRCCHGKSQ